MTQQRLTNRRAAVQVRTINPEETFRAANEGRDRSSQENFRTEDGDASVSYSGADRVLMWKPVMDGHGEVLTYQPRTIPTSHIGFNQAAGWRSTCPDCGTNHEDSELPISDPNSCPGREKVAVRLCPVCGDRTVDNQGFKGEEVGITVEGEPVIANDFASMSSPEERTKQQLYIHLWMRHPRQAQVMQIPELTGSWREAVQAIRPA